MQNAVTAMKPIQYQRAGPDANMPLILNWCGIEIARAA